MKPLPRTTLEPVCKSLARVIQERREYAKLSPNQLAAQTNLSRTMIRFVETNERIPTLDTIARISRALGIPLSKLVAEAEDRLKP